MKNKYACDFEATNDRETAHVWSWESLEIGQQDNPSRGTDIDSFLNWASLSNKTVYFHNLKYDGSYILSRLFQLGYEWVEKKDLRPRTLTTLISDLGVYYTISVHFENGNRLELIDSYKIISLSVHDMALAYGLPISKGEIDYNKDRPVGYLPTKEEWEYQHKDVVILSLCLDIVFKQGFTRITQSSNALNDLKETLGKKKFKLLYPILDSDVDSFCRQAYYGGLSMASPKFAGLSVGEGVVYDVNSEYPWAMNEKMLPFGKPNYYDGKYVKDDDFPLFIQKIECSFKLKDGYLPTIQAKHVPRFKADKLLYDSQGRVVELTLTSIDLELFLEHYEVKLLKYICGYKFQANETNLRKYIQKWYSVKEKATIEHNKGLRTISKDMLNKPSGKFGTKPKVCSKIPYYDGKIKYKLSEIEEREPVYVPLICFVTAWGRWLCMTNAQKNYDRFLYMDTDSNHFLGNEPVEGLPIDSKKLGYFKNESCFTRGKFLHAKCYVEETKTTEEEKNALISAGDKSEQDFYYYKGQLVYLKVTVAGLPKNCHSNVTFDNFKVGAEYDGKLRPYMTPNGQILEETSFKIKD